MQFKVRGTNTKNTKRSGQKSCLYQFYLLQNCSSKGRNVMNIRLPQKTGKCIFRGNHCMVFFKQQPPTSPPKTPKLKQISPQETAVTTPFKPDNLNILVFVCENKQDMICTKLQALI